jgi:hypothetical protein
LRGLVFVLCRDGIFYELVPEEVQHQGPWQGSPWSPGKPCRSHCRKRTQKGLLLHVDRRQAGFLAHPGR